MAPTIKIGAPRFELGTFRTRTERATRLRYAPKIFQSRNAETQIYSETCIAQAKFSNREKI